MGAVCSLCIRRYLEATPHDKTPFCPSCRAPADHTDLRKDVSLEVATKAFSSARARLLALAQRPAAAEAARRLAHGSRSVEEAEVRSHLATAPHGADPPKHLIALEHEQQRGRPGRRRRRHTADDDDLEEEDWRDSAKKRRQAEEETEAPPPDGRPARLRRPNARYQQEDEIQIVETEDEEEDEKGGPSAPPDRLPPGMVRCPVCQMAMKETALYMHIDSCLSKSEHRAGVAGAGPVSPPKPALGGGSLLPRRGGGKPLQPLPKLAFNLMKDAQLKQKMRDLGLSATGTKAVSSNCNAVQGAFELQHDSPQASMRPSVVA